MGDLALMRLGMVANTISVAFFGIVWQPWQADLVDLSVFFQTRASRMDHVFQHDLIHVDDALTPLFTSGGLLPQVCPSQNIP